MRDARRLDGRITIGAVPDSEDLDQLVELGFKTLIDVRDADEKFGGLVEKRARERGLTYISIPMVRGAITIDEVLVFHRQVYRRGSAPLYCFSRYGKRPLALLLLFEAVASHQPLVYVYRKAATFGLDLQGDAVLDAFLVDFYNTGRMESVVAAIREVRPDLLRP